MTLTKKLRPIWYRSIGRLDGQYRRELNAAIGNACGSLLDVGCGFNSPIQGLAMRPKYIVGVDGWAPAIEESRRKRIHDEYVQMSLLDIGLRFAPETFDCVLASDVIEHLEREDGYKLISQMERIARTMVVIFTPNGFLLQGAEYGNPFQQHLSGWSVAEMRARGYEVVGIEGLKWLRGEMARIRWRPIHFWLCISLLSQGFVRNHPRWSFRILCIRRKQPIACKGAGLGGI